MPRLLLALTGGYLLGSIPFSYLVARAYGVADVRKVGSGNVGATNVMRSAGRTAGILAFLLDATKGGAATFLVTRLVPDDPATAAFAALAAVLGHIFPVWLRGKGGKGVATGVGAFIPLAPAASGLAIVVFGLTLAVSRYVSLSSVIAAASLPTMAAALGAPVAVWLPGAFCAAVIVSRHRPNLERLWAGTESRVGRGGTR